MTYGRVHPVPRPHPNPQGAVLAVRRSLLLPAVALALLTACGTEVPDVAAPGGSPVASGPPSTASPSTASLPAVAAPTPSVRVIEVSVAGGSVTGPGSRVQAVLGEDLVIRVTSDVADEVHVHGYDERAEVPAGGTVEIPFTADIPGGFEVELEGTGQLLFQLRVA